MAEPLLNHLRLSFQACGCNSRCFHCSVGNEASRAQPMRLEDIRECISAMECANTRTPSLYDRLSVCWLSEPADQPELEQLIAFLVTKKLFEGTLATNGERLAAEPGSLRRLAGIGVHALQVSLYGLGDDHDKLEGRRGAWSQKLSVITRAVAAGLTVCVPVFARHGRFGEMPAIIKAVDAAAGAAAVRYSITVWMPIGRGLYNDALIPTETDFDVLPPEVRSLPRLDLFKPEYAWLDLALKGAMDSLLAAFMSAKQSLGAPDHVLSLDAENKVGIQELIGDLYTRFQAHKRSSASGVVPDVPLNQLAGRVGQPHSTRMHTVLSMVRTWENRARAGSVR